VRALPGATVVRFNGGAQAGHNVVTPDGRHHTFSQFGAGTFVAGVRTHLAARVIVHPTALLVEARCLEATGVNDALERLTVDPRALVVTPFHQAACRLRELSRGAGRHGSCGVGVGEVVRDSLAHPEDALRVGDLADAGSLPRRLGRVRERILEDVRGLPPPESGGDGWDAEMRVAAGTDAVDAWIDATRPFVARVEARSDADLGEGIRAGTPVVFEGAQGVLLDEDRGFHPHTTWSRCTFSNVDELLREVTPDRALLRLGVARVHAHRHGPGPLPTESSELGAALAEPHNGDGGWQGRFRLGWPDLVLARYARAACGRVDAVALTHVDALAAPVRWRIARSYDGGSITNLPAHPPQDLDGRAAATARLMRVEPDLREVEVGDVQDALAEAYGAPIRLRSTGPTTRHVWTDVIPQAWGAQHASG
jgi:adenylosuccinate synthase